MTTGSRSRKYGVRTLGRLAERKTPKCELPCFGVSFLGGSYGSRISLPVRHALDSHATLPYLATSIADFSCRRDHTPQCRSPMIGKVVFHNSASQNPAVRRNPRKRDKILEKLDESRLTDLPRR